MKWTSLGVLHALTLFLLVSFAVPGVVAEEGAAVEEPSAIPFKAERSTAAESSPRIVLVTMLAIASALAVVWGLRRRMRAQGVLPMTKTQRIQLVEVRRITTKTVVAIVAVDDREYLMAQSGDHLQLVEHRHAVAAAGDQA